MKTLKCDMEKTCNGAVTYIDEKGFIYCTIHGAMRRMYRSCRKLKLSEVKQLESGQPLKSYRERGAI